MKAAEWVHQSGVVGKVGAERMARRSSRRFLDDVCLRLTQEGYRPCRLGEARIVTVTVNSPRRRARCKTHVIVDVLQP